MILCIGTTPAAQRVMIFSRLELDQVNRATRTLDGAAGKSINVAKVLQLLGERPFATGFLGGPRGEQLLHLLEKRGLEMEFVKVATPTRECVTVIDERAGTITELVEESRAVDPGAYDKLLAIVERQVTQCCAVVLSGTIASGGPSDLYFRCTEMAHRAGALAVVDASGPALVHALKAKPSVIKPNRTELEATVGEPLRTEQAVTGAMMELHGRGAERVVVTAGASVVLATDGQQVWRLTTPAIKAVNPIGSGDAFTAGLVWRLVAGDALGDACRWAVAAGAANALNPMAGELSRTDVDRLHEFVEVTKV